MMVDFEINADISSNISNCFRFIHQVNTIMEIVRIKNPLQSKSIYNIILVGTQIKWLSIMPICLKSRKHSEWSVFGFKLEY